MPLSLNTESQQHFITITTCDRKGGSVAAFDDTRRLEGKLVMPSKLRKLHKAAVLAPMLRHFEPMPPTLVQKPFSSQQWLFEPKWDGWRAMCFVKDGEAHFVSRKQNSLNERFPQLKDAGKVIQATTAVLDGEIVALDEKGLPRLMVCARSEQEAPLSFTPSTCFTWTVMTSVAAL